MGVTLDVYVEMNFFIKWLNLGDKFRSYKYNLSQNMPELKTGM